MTPLWILVAIVAVTAIGTKAFHRGLKTVGEASYNVMEHIVAPALLLALVLGAALLVGAATQWVVNGGPNGWCESAEDLANRPPNRKLTESEFMDVLNRHRGQNLTDEQLVSLAQLESRRTPGCWHFGE